MNYSEIKKLDEESLQQLTEGTGPSDKCICSLLSPPDGDKRGLKASIKRAFGSIGSGKKRGRTEVGGGKSIDIPLSFTKGGKGIFTTKESVKRTTPCGKCSCDNENIVMKHSFANIRITSPDVSSICPCPSDCLPDKQKLDNNIRVTIERLQLDPDSVDSEFSLIQEEDVQSPPEPNLSVHKRSITDLIDEQYDEESADEWSSGGI